MKLSHYLLITILSWISFTAQASDVLTEGSLKEMIQSIDNAIHQRNADVIADYFTDDAVIILRFAGKGMAGMKYNVKGYQRRLQQAWSMPMEYEYQTKNISIVLLDGGETATINSVILETVTLDDDEVMVTETQEKLHVVSEQGKARISRLEGLLAIK